MKKAALCLLVFAVLLGLLSACAEAPETQRVKLIDTPLTDENYAFGVDKNQPELLEAVNDFIDKILSDGTLEEICEKHFGNGEPTPVKSMEPDESKDQLVIATNAMFAPFEYMEGDSYYGIDMEIAAALAEYLGKELVIMDMDFEAVCLSVGQGKCDIAMAGLTINESRKEHVTFSEPYYQASQLLMVKESDTTFDACKSVSEIEEILNGFDSSVKVGVQSGTTAQYYLEGDEEWGFPGFPVICMGYHSAALAVQDMLNGNISFVLVDKAPAQYISEIFNQSGSDFGKNVSKFWGRFVDEGGYKLVLEGLGNTVVIAVLGLLIGIVVGILIATARIVPKYKLLPRILNRICSVYVGFFRGTPIVVQLLLGYYVLLPLLGLNYPALYVCVVVFGLNSGAYVSEIMRGGIASVDSGQLEAGRALGLSFAVTMCKIVIPQAVKNILPTLGNEFVSLIKETSVVSFVSAVDIYKAFNVIATNSYEYVVPYLAMAIVYIVLVALISLLVKMMERRLNCSDKRFASK